MTAAIYTRISHDRAGTELGVERQEAECRSWLRDRLDYDGPVAAYCDNDVPISKRDADAGARPKKTHAWDRMLAAIAAPDGPEVVVFWALDRAYRSTRGLGRLVLAVQARERATGHRVRIASVAGGQMVNLFTAEGKFQANILASAAEFEIDKMGERQRARHQQTQAAGRYSGGPRPYGYDFDKDAPGGLVVRPGEAAIIRELADRLIEGESITGVLRDLNARAIPTARGGHRWSAQVLKDMLCSAHLTGIRQPIQPRGGQRLKPWEQGAITGEPTWPAILAPEEVELIRRRYRAQAATPRRFTENGYLLAGLVACARCGGPVLGHARIRPGGRRVETYRCAASSNGGSCPGVSVMAEPFDAYVTGMFLRDLLAEGVAGRATPDGAAAWERKAEAAQQMLAELAEDRLAGVLSREAYNVGAEKARTALADAQAQLAKLAAGRPGRQALTSLAGAASAEALERAWDALAVHQRRAAIAAWFAAPAITLAPGVVGRKGFDADRVTLNWPRRAQRRATA